MYKQNGHCGTAAIFNQRLAVVWHSVTCYEWCCGDDMGFFVLLCFLGLLFAVCVCCHVAFLYFCTFLRSVSLSFNLSLLHSWHIFTIRSFAYFSLSSLSIRPFESKIGINLHYDWPESLVNAELNLGIPASSPQVGWNDVVLNLVFSVPFSHFFFLRL